MKKLLLGLLLFVSGAGLFAQSIFKIKETIKSETGEIIHARIENPAVASTVSNDVTLFENIYGKAPGVTFKYIREFKTSDGHVNKIYEQYANNLRVEGASFSLHTLKGKAESVGGNYAQALPPVGKTSLTYKDAEAIAKKRENQSFTKTPLKGEGYEMVYSKNEIKNLKEYKLAYKIKLTGGTIIEYKYYIIDANTGDLLNIEYAVCTANAPGSGASLYTGTLNFTGDDFNTGLQFRLMEVRNGVTIRTFNNNHSFNETGLFATDFTDNDNNWTAGEHPNDRGAIDAHWGAEQVFDYWFNVHGRNSLNDAGMAMRSFVHVGTAFENGYWSPTNQAVFFGDGNTLFRPVTSLDWCAHEFGHGICQFTSNLTYNFGESGALNEGFSDIWGACVEAAAAPGKQRWLIFEETLIPSPFHERNMANPVDGRFPQPDRFNGPHWGDLGNDPHINSGVLNHWFFLISEGGKGANAIGIASAEQIAYLTEQNLAPGSNYQNARTESILAARALFGVGSCEEMSVTRAWFAVGVGANYPTVSLAISGLEIPCTNALTTYTINSTIPPGSSIVWTITPDDGSVVLTPNGNSVDLDASNALRNYPYTLRAFLTGTCDQGSTFYQFNIHDEPWWGHITGTIGGMNTTYATALVEGDNYVYHYQGADFFSVNIYSWTSQGYFPGAWWEYLPGDYANGWGAWWINFYFPYGPGDAYYNFHYTDDCGSHTVPFHFISSYSTPPGYKVAPGKYTLKFSPNPASSFINITVEENTDAAKTDSRTFDYSSIKTIRVYDKVGNIIMQRNEIIPKTGLRLNVSGLKADIYSVIIEDRNGVRAAGKLMKR